VARDGQRGSGRHEQEQLERETHRVA
jgi:hypothetical protein